MTALNENYDTNELVLEDDTVDSIHETTNKDESNSNNAKRSTIFERWTEKFKEFLDKA